jgi:soluble lytic murein transglycosylase-like protein
MDKVRLLIGALALAAASPAWAQSVARWRPYVEEASARFGVPIPWIERVMRAESAGRTRLNGRPITSPAGAMGLMQLMPATWAEMRARLGLGRDPHHPRDNILAGTYYLRLIYERFGHPGLFAAYNAGPGRYAEHLRAARPLPRETRAYLVAVAGANTAPPRTPAPATGPPAQSLFFALSPSRPAPAPSANRAEADGLFVIRR